MDAFVNLTGNVGGDVVLKFTRNNIAYASFRMASTPRLRRNGDWTDGETTWITVVCYRGLAENVANSVGRGDPVTVVGKLRTQAWVDAQNVENERLVVEANTVGHDLNRGTSAFRRTERQVRFDDPFELSEIITEAERKTEEAQQEAQQEAQGETQDEAQREAQRELADLEESLALEPEDVVETRAGDGVEIPDGERSAAG